MPELGRYAPAPLATRQREALWALAKQAGMIPKSTPVKGTMTRADVLAAKEAPDAE